jgi:tRNA (adenine57-N1/adenine58-N1)-methyltransferase
VPSENQPASGLPTDAAAAPVAAAARVEADAAACRPCVEPTGAAQIEPAGAAHRRGPFRAGDRVQLTDPKGRMTTIELAAGAIHHTYKGTLSHDQLIGQPEGSVVRTTGEVPYLALRPTLADWVLSMPRGAAVVYPKDAAQIVAMADIYPGARVIEAGAGSGGLTMSLLRAVGDGGSLLSVERRSEFAAIARANVEDFFGGPHPAWRLVVGSLDEVVASLVAAEGAGDAAGHQPIADRMVLDMLAPWENLAAAAAALEPGGVLLAYVATATQLSRLAEAIRQDGRFTEPVAWENMVRGWHLEGLSVRPEHRMVGHTGFLISTRRLAPGAVPPPRKRRPAPGAYGEADENGERPVLYADASDWTEEAVGIRQPGKRKLKKVAARAARAVNPDPGR